MLLVEVAPYWNVNQARKRGLVGMLLVEVAPYWNVNKE